MNLLHNVHRTVIEYLCRVSRGPFADVLLEDIVINHTEQQQTY